MSEKGKIIWFDLDHYVYGAALKGVQELGYKIIGHKKIPKKKKWNDFFQGVAAVIIEPLHFVENYGECLSQDVEEMIKYLKENNIPIVFFSMIEEVIQISDLTSKEISVMISGLINKNNTGKNVKNKFCALTGIK
jgi:hypothetical protein